MKMIMQIYKNILPLPLTFLFLIADINLKAMLRNRSLNSEALRFRNIAQQKSLERRKAQKESVSTLKIPASSPTSQPNPLIFEKERLKKQEINRLVAATLKEIQSQLKENEFFIYEKGTVKGVPVSKNVLMLSKTLQNMIGPEDALEENIRMIPFEFPYDIISPAFTILNNWHVEDLETKTNKEKLAVIQTSIQNQPSQKIIEVSEFISETLDCNDSVKEAYSSALKDHIWNSKEKMVNFFSGIKHFSLWKTFLVNSAIIGYLKGSMMKYNITHIKPEYLKWKPTSSYQKIRSITFPDEKSILVGMSHDSGQIISADQSLVFFTLLDKLHSNPDGSNKTNFFIYTGYSFGKIEKEKQGYPRILFHPRLDFTHKPIQKTIFNPINNAQLLVGLHNNTAANNLRLYDKNLATQQLNLIRTFTGHQKAIQDIAFNEKGSQIVSADTGDTNNLKLWDIDDTTQINSWSLPGINSIAFSSDGTKIIATYGNTILCIIDLNKPNQLQNIPLIADHPYASALSFTLTKDDQMLAWDYEGNLFLITFDDNGITNEIQIQDTTLISLAKNGSMTSLTISSDDKKIITARMNFFGQDFLELYTSLTDFDNEVLKLFTNISDSDLEKNIGTYSLMYQFWLNSRKGIDLKSYQMDATEQKIYDSLSEQIKRLF